MRNTFVSTLMELIHENDNTYLITGDLGYGVLDEFRKQYPDRFINAGISEQIMTSVATGMGITGNKVFTYSIANFPSLRCLEQIRDGVLYHNADVKIVSIGSGMAYGGAGMTHHGTEDMAIMRALPGITIFSPCDPCETIEITRAAYQMNTPCYIRIGKGGEKNLHSKPIEDIFHGNELCSGTDICIITTGAIASEAVEASEVCKLRGIGVAVYSIPTIKPIDKQLIKRCSVRFEHIITLEEHNLFGGLGSAVAEIIAEMPGNRATLLRMGLQDVYPCIVGNQSYLRKQYGISSTNIVDSITTIINSTTK